MTTLATLFSAQDLAHLNRAVELARSAEKNGNLPIGSLIVLEGKVIAEGASSVFAPHYHPGRHAETEALLRVPVGLWQRAKEMTCYTTLEPCPMCLGALVIHRIGRIVFGAYDTQGGASSLLTKLPQYVSDHIGLPEWIGPALPEVCDELYAQTFQILREKGFII